MILVDTGPLVAILHRADQDHNRCVEVAQRIRGPMLTTWPVLTEAMYLLDFSSRAQSALLTMIQRDALQTVNLQRSDIPRLQHLVETYHNLPMDFADASLVTVAEREGLYTVFTLDRRDFSVYRAHGNQAFELVP